MLGSDVRPAAQDPGGGSQEPGALRPSQPADHHVSAIGVAVTRLGTGRREALGERGFMYSHRKNENSSPPHLEAFEEPSAFLEFLSHLLQPFCLLNKCHTLHKTPLRATCPQRELTTGSQAPSNPVPWMGVPAACLGPSLDLGHCC